MDVTFINEYVDFYFVGSHEGYRSNEEHPAQDVTAVRMDGVG